MTSWGLIILTLLMLIAGVLLRKKGLSLVIAFAAGWISLA